MVELQRREPEPPDLVGWRINHPNDLTAEFNSVEFRPTKNAVKRLLNEDQGGLCAYCELPLDPTAGQIDHVIPKGGPHGRPDLALHYDNWVHSCIDNKHCGQKRGDSLLPITPAPQCNSDFVLTSDGFLDARETRTRQQRHAVRSCRDMLGLNHPALKLLRGTAVKNLQMILRMYPNEAEIYLGSQPFRYILRHYLKGPAI